MEPLHVEKRAIGVVRVDPADEIFANKICALLGRAEIRDLVDVMALEQSGLSLERALLDGQRKDGGLTPAQLAWVIVDRLTRMARP
ncbi:MAG: nucleotidyl transferase AbiEii/AbiGii toxin family protein [Vicinamibacterales bacterium]